MIQYELPKFLNDIVERDVYITWLDNKKSTHYKRDKEYFGDKFPNDIEPQHYKKAIHKAVKNSEGRCFYTGEKLKWELINQFGSKELDENTRHNKKYFASVPTLEHIDRSEPNSKFAITSWKVNDAKNDLNLEEFFELCEQVLANKDRIIEKLK